MMQFRDVLGKMRLPHSTLTSLKESLINIGRNATLDQSKRPNKELDTVILIM